MLWRQRGTDSFYREVPPTVFAKSVIHWAIFLRRGVLTPSFRQSPHGLSDVDTVVNFICYLIDDHKISPSLPTEYNNLSLLARRK